MTEPQRDHVKRPDLYAHTAALVVKVFPTGQPEKVRIEVTDIGPEPLTGPEAITVLREALALLRLGEPGSTPDDWPQAAG